MEDRYVSSMLRFRLRSLPSEIGVAHAFTWRALREAEALREWAAVDGTVAYAGIRLARAGNLTDALLPAAQQALEVSLPFFAAAFRVETGRSELELEGTSAPSAHSLALSFAQLVAEASQISAASLGFQVVKREIDRWRLMRFGILRVRRINFAELERRLFPEALLASDLRRQRLGGGKYRGAEHAIVPLIPKKVRASTTSTGKGKQSRALAALFEHPDWSLERIASEAGCRRQSLYRMPKFMQAWKSLHRARRDIARGFKDSETGEFDAWDADGEA